MDVILKKVQEALENLFKSNLANKEILGGLERDLKKYKEFVYSRVMDSEKKEKYERLLRVNLEHLHDGLEMSKEHIEEAQKLIQEFIKYEKN